MTPEFRGISRMTNVSSPLERLGKLTATAAEAERLRRKPWLAAAKWVRGTLESKDRISHYANGTVSANSPTFLSAAAAVLLVTGAASVLSPIGADLAANTGSGKTGTQRLAAIADVSAAPEPARATETAQANVKEAEPNIVSYEEADGVSPMLQVASAYAAASAVIGSRLEPTAVALTKTNGAAPQPLVTLAEYRAAPAPVASLYMAVLNGLPAGSRVSKGLQVGKGEWVLALDDLAGVEIAVPTSVKRLVVARVEISGQDGVSIASFPLVVDPEGRIDTETVASVAVMKDAGLAQRPTKVAARIEAQAPQPVRAKPQAKSQQNSQKDAVAPTAPQQKRKTAAVRPAAPIIKPTTTANIPIDSAEAIAAAPVGIMPEGSAGLETFRTFSLLGGPERP